MRDYYGRLRPFQVDNPLDQPERYEIEIHKADNVEIVYSRFYDMGEEPCAIWKETTTSDEENGVETYKHEFAYAPWADRESTEYHPINDCWNID